MRYIQAKMYDELARPEGHNPTIGLLLCADTDEGTLFHPQQ